MSAGLGVQAVTKSFSNRKVVNEVSFEVPPGTIVALLGPSGCGKSTLLNLIAGLEQPDSGEIQWDDYPLAGIPPYRRGFGLMFQDFALFPHRNVFENIAFGLCIGKMPSGKIKQRVEEVLELVGLEGFGRRDVNTLSGGEQQRVALARALAPRPRLLMLDEPLGSLDRSLRQRLVNDLRQVLHLSGQTAIYVTHDQEEAFLLAERVVVMNAGRVAQNGAPLEIYRRPASTFVARFLGLDNILVGVLSENRGQIRLETVLGRFPLASLRGHAPGAVTFLLRPDAVHLTPAGSQPGDCSFRAEVIDRSFRGSAWQIQVRAGESRLRFEIPSNHELPKPGQTLCLSFDPDQALQLLSK